MRKEAETDEWKKLYETATKIKETAPWEYLWDMDIIYLEDEDAYVSILGRGGETYGISVYEGKEGFDDFKILASRDKLNISPNFAMYLQNNLTCYWGNRDELSKKQRDIIKELGYKYRGKNQWLYFMSFKTGYIPYNFNQEEVIKMTTYLNALLNALKLYISKKPNIDFENGNMMCYSTQADKIGSKKIPDDDIVFQSADLTEDDELIDDLSQMPRTLKTIEIDILAINISIKDKTFERPVNPTMCIIADEKSGMVLASELSDPDTNAFVNFAGTFINTLYRFGLPQKVYVSNSFAFSLLEDICKCLNIKLELRYHLPAVEEAEESFMSMMQEE